MPTCKETFEMGQYEVTNEQYAKFQFHSTGRWIPRSYNTKMGTNPNGGITAMDSTDRTTQGDPEKEKWPVNFVSL